VVASPTGENYHERGCSDLALFNNCFDSVLFLALHHRGETQAQKQTRHIDYESALRMDGRWLDRGVDLVNDRQHHTCRAFYLNRSTLVEKAS
jgi:hypothetical protein